SAPYRRALLLAAELAGAARSRSARRSPRAGTARIRGGAPVAGARRPFQSFRRGGRHLRGGDRRALLSPGGLGAAAAREGGGESGRGGRSRKRGIQTIKY